MTSPRRPHPPGEAVSKRGIAEAVGRRLKEELPPPKRPFGEEMVEEVEQTLRRVTHIEGPCELGVYNEDEDRSSPARLGGDPRTIAFDGTWRAWFERLTPELRVVLMWLAGEFRDKDRQTALLELVDERIERRVLRGFLRRLWHAAIAAVITSAVAVHWFGDQIGWLTEKMPVFKAFWNLITGART